MPTTPHEWLTIAEVAARLRVSKMTIYRLAGEGAIGSIRIGAAYRISAAAVDEYIERQRIPA